MPGMGMGNMPGMGMGNMPGMGMGMGMGLASPRNQSFWEILSVIERGIGWYVRLFSAKKELTFCQVPTFCTRYYHQHCFRHSLCAKAQF